MRDTTKWLVAAAAAVGAVIVAGLQLSKLPSGVFAYLALSGFLMAIIGVAIIILSAANVLSVGYTTLGQLTDIYYEPEESRRDKVNQASEELEEARGLLDTLPWYKSFKAWLHVVRLGRRLERRKRGETEEGILISEMVDYLDRDTIVLSTGLARNVPELYDRIRETDDEIIALRDGKVAKHVTGRSISEKIKRRRSRGVQGSASRDHDGAVILLESAQWRSTRLEAAGARLIAFANQKLIERKFQRLKTAVTIGGILVATGVAVFAIAPQLGTPSLQVDRPTNVTVHVLSGEAIARGCTRTVVQGVAIGGPWREPTIVTVAAPGCPSKILILRDKIGYAVPSLPPTPSPTPSPP